MPGHMRRFASFAIIGGVVFLLSVALVQLAVVTTGLDPRVTYPFTLTLAITVNFLLNRRFTWSGRDVDFWRSAWQFATSRIGTATIEYALFTGLVYWGVIVLPAQTVAVAMAMVLNYICAHLVFASNEHDESQLNRTEDAVYVG